MNTAFNSSSIFVRHSIAALCLAGATLAPSADAATRPVDERRAADPRGSVEIVNTSGRVTVTGWDRPEIAITGTLDERIERLEFTSTGDRTVIRVGQHKDSGMRWQSGDAVLNVSVPRQSRLNASLTSADLVVRDLQGEQRLSTVSGDIDAEVGAEGSVRSISGDLRLVTGSETRRLEINTVSGDTEVTGRAGGRIDARTVSGDSRFALGAVSDASFKTVSGDLSMTLGLEPGGRLAAESVSGDVHIDFTGALPAARFELRSFNGGINLCPAVEQSASVVKEDRGEVNRRREFRNGDGQGRVEVQTMSSDIRLCATRDGR